MRGEIELLPYLRQHTAVDHRALDAQPGLRRLMKDPSLTEYAVILAKLGVAFRESEQYLKGRSLPATMPYDESRARAIEEDLDKLPAVGVSGRQALVFDKTSPWAAAGVRYVLDGSSQGSRFISGRLQKNLPGLTELGAVQYWRVQEQVAGRWDEFCRSMGRTVSSVEADEALCGARATFSLFQACFDEREEKMAASPSPANGP